MSSIYDSLNGPQKEAVLTTEGPVLILAGAGSGKTRVLTHRIAYLIQEKNVAPYNILAITFTNKAAQEMRDRVDRLLPGMDGSEVWVSTFHSMCVRILRRHINKIGFDNNFTIYDTEDSKTIAKRILKKMNIDSKQLNEKTCLSVISDCKNRFINEVEYANSAFDFKEKKIAEVFAEYQKELMLNNALDFDDLLVKTVELFRDVPDVLDYYQKRFRYIHVDEYQDTNGVQFELISQLASAHENLCVVGDDDQSIYKFRGADIGNILSFEHVFKGAKVIKLEQNYRSTPSILDVANAVISHNRGRKDKRLWSDKEQGEQVKFIQFRDQREEANEVIKDIQEHVKNDGEEYKEIAVLYRTNAQSRSFEESCIYRNIPYRVVGGVNFYHRAEIKDILGYLKTVANGKDDLAVRRIVNMPKRGIGDTSVERASVYAEDHGLTLYEAFKEAKNIPGLGRAAGKIEGFVDQIRALKAKSREMGIAELIRNVVDDINYEDELLKLDEEQADAKRDNIQELINKASEFDKKYEDADMLPSLDVFLEEVALIADIDSVEDGDNRILLMTLHGAKGLEFDRVYLCGMEEDLFPSYMSSISEDPSDIEEERRLAYVGITRARKHLSMTAAETRMRNGEIMFHKVSRFVKEVPDGMLLIGNNKKYSSSPKQNFTPDIPKRKSTAGMFGTNPGFGKDISSLFSKPKVEVFEDYLEGDRVSHDSFGSGTVISVDGKGKDAIITIEFDTRGIKKMKLAFAAPMMKKI